MTDIFSYFEQKFGKQDHPLPVFKADPLLIMNFETFLSGNYAHGKHNLYTVWYRRQALYVGIARDNIWNRWFSRGGQSHMYFVQKHSGTREGGRWAGITPVGRVIAINLPKSLKWKVELRHCNTFSWCNDELLEDAERRLIREFHPLFNTTYRSPLTEKESRLIERLTHVNL